MPYISMICTGSHKTSVSKKVSMLPINTKPEEQEYEIRGLNCFKVTAIKF